MKKRPLVCAFTLALCLSAPVFAVEGTLTSQDDTLLIPGFTYTNRVAETSGGQITSFTLAVDQSSTAYPIAVQGSGLMYAAGNINRAITYAESLGYYVIGAINSDYFSLTTGVPTGIVIEDGIYKSSPSSHSSILFNGSETTVIGDTQIPITVTNHTSGENITLQNLNKFRTDTGGLYLLNSDFSTNTRTSTEGIMVRMVPDYEEIHGSSGGKLTVNNSITLTVTDVIDTSYSWDIGEHDYILTAAHESGYREVLEAFEIGDRITITTTTSNTALQQAQWATGGGDIMIENGAITNSSSWLHSTEGRNPRTAFGVKADGTMVFYAVDGRQTGYSVGLTQKELANHLLEEGCVAAVNLDGGGSTSFAVSQSTDPNIIPTAELVNSPSDTWLRNCATYVLLVDPRTPNHLTLSTPEEYILIESSLDLGRIVLRDINETILDQYPNESTLTASSNLGSVSSDTDSDGYTIFTYTAYEPGTENLLFTGYSGLSGTKQLEVVDHLTSLQVKEVGKDTALSGKTLSTGQTLDLELMAKYNNSSVFLNGNAVSWRVVPGEGVETNGNIGSVNENGHFIAGEENCAIEIEAGGITISLPITIYNMFEDVPQDHWAHDAILYLFENDYIKGISTTQYGMGYEIRRGDFVLMLYGAMGSPEVTNQANFSDVDFLDYYHDAIAWASNEGIVSGLGDGSFGAKTSITREQALLILNKTYASLGYSIPTSSLYNLSAYKDAKDISTYALSGVAALSGQGVISDSTNYLYPKTALTRESMALFLYEMLMFEEVEIDSPTSMSLHPNEIYLVPGQTYNLLPIIEPMGSGGNITWTSSDPSAVSVNAAGQISNVFKGTGQPVVTVTAKLGTLTASCIVRCVAEGTETPSVPSLNLPFFQDEDNTTGGTTSGGLITTTSTGMVVNAPTGLNVRSGPGSDYSIIAMVQEGVIVTLYGKTEDDWYHMSCQYTDPDTGATTNILGYVMGQYMEEKVILGTVIDADILNMRSGAGTAFDVVLRLPKGTQVAVLQVFTDWYKIQVTANGEPVIGFVASQYLEVEA